MRETMTVYCGCGHRHAVTATPHPTRQDCYIVAHCDELREITGTESYIAADHAVRSYARAYQNYSAVEVPSW